jgi:outer membrane receptor protein involved in Fe transport
MRIYVRFCKTTPSYGLNQPRCGVNGCAGRTAGTQFVNRPLQIFPNIGRYVCWYHQASTRRWIHACPDFSMLRFGLIFLFLPVLLTHFSGTVRAQSAPGQRLTGTVTDAATKQPIPFATVAVWQKTARDSALAGGSQTDGQGKFTVANLTAGRYSVSLTFVGYQSVTRLVTLSGTSTDVDLGPVSLAADAALLNEVRITGEKAALTLSAEKRVFNVAKNLTSVGGTAESLLRNVPSITLDESGAPNLRNMPTAIYINGKPTQLTLAQIPANQIESVEVIANPSARYDASTSGGIVNLVLKRNQKPGYNGTASVGIGNNNRYDATVNLDLRTGKWNLSALYSLNATQNPLTGSVNRINRTAAGLPASYFDQTTAINLDNTFQNGRLLADFTPNKNNLFSLATTLVGGAYNTVSNQTYEYRNASGTPTSSGSRRTVPQNNFTNVGVEFDWKHSFARNGRELSLMSSFTQNRVSNAADWLTTAVDDQGVSLPTYPETDRIDGRIIGSQYIAQLDYVQPVNDSTKWEFGVRSFTFNRDTQYLFNQLGPDGKAFTLIPDYSQDAYIRETVNAAYALYTRKMARNVSIQAGLRVEQSSLHGLSRFDGSTFGYDYPSRTGANWFQAFFPSFSVTKQLSETTELALSLSRKVGRPNFRHVFVGIQANDRQNITIGNPAVRPEFVNTGELSYTHTKGSLQWISTAYYIYEDHTIKPFTQPSATDPTVLVTTFLNVKADIQTGIDNTLSVGVGKNLTVLANINPFYAAIQTLTTNSEVFNYNAKLNLTYKFPLGITAQLSGTRDRRFPQVQGYRLPIWSADMAVRKSFMQNRASVVFSVNDLFNSRRGITVYDQPLAFQTTTSRREIRFYKLTVQFPLGKPDATFRRNTRKVERPDVDFSTP